jgi:hypothetical protein
MALIEFSCFLYPQASAIFGANVLMHSEIFQNLTLSSGQNVEDFFCQIYEKGKLLNKPEHEMLSKFISGLPEQMSISP